MGLALPTKAVARTRHQHNSVSMIAQAKYWLRYWNLDTTAFAHVNAMQESNVLVKVLLPVIGGHTRTDEVCP